MQTRIDSDSQPDCWAGAYGGSAAKDWWVRERLSAWCCDAWTSAPPAQLGPPAAAAAPTQSVPRMCWHWHCTQPGCCQWQTQRARAYACPTTKRRAALDCASACAAEPGPCARTPAPTSRTARKSKHWAGSPARRMMPRVCRLWGARHWRHRRARNKARGRPGPAATAVWDESRLLPGRGLGKSRAPQGCCSPLAPGCPVMQALLMPAER